MCYKTGMQIHPVLFLFVAAVTSACQTSVKSVSTRCILPPYPDNGRYEVAGDPTAQPGDELEYVYLNVSCNNEYGVVGNNVALCILGEWSTSLPQCVPYCYIQDHPTVTYSCKMPGAQQFEECDEYPPMETSVRPECRPGYYSEVDMPLMRCINGTWTNMPKCVPECGRAYPDYGYESWPWSVLIYKRSTNASDETTFEQIGMGSIISANVIITAAQCFLQFGSFLGFDKTEYLVIVRSNNMASSVKFSEKDVKIPKSYRTPTDHFDYQHGIALVILSQAFTFTVNLHPVCLDFDPIFNGKQLQEGNLGRVAVYPYTDDEEKQYKLMVHRMSYVPFYKCIQKSPPGSIQNITGDKFCVSNEHEYPICGHNTGVGLTFKENRLDVDRHYLRGIVVPLAAPLCTLSGFSSCIDINSFKHFIQDNLATSLPPCV